MQIELMNKEQLRDYAKLTFGAVLDMRKSIETLQEEVKRMKPKEPLKLEKQVVEKPKFLKNKTTGFFWPWTALLEARGDLIPCDENGNDS